MINNLFPTSYKVGDYTIRGAQSQILENMQQIAEHWEVDRVLADFGIKVLGRLESASPYLTDPSDPLYINAGENYGDAYLVGPENLDPDKGESYPVYIWTRANVNTGHTEPYWLYTGRMSVQGPQGPAGKYISNVSFNSNFEPTFVFSDGSKLYIGTRLKGDKGDPGTNGKTPRVVALQEESGVRINTYDGDNRLVNSVFVSNGQPGEPGSPGAPGQNASLNIIGTFTTLDTSDPNGPPLPSTRQMGDAFIYSTNNTTTLYILTGTPGQTSTYAWQETSFGGGTKVLVNGNEQDTWNADTKLDKVSTGGTARVYGITSANAQTMIKYSSSATGSVLVQRDSSGQITVPTTPSSTGHATSKSYVDGKINTINNTISGIDSRVSSLEGGGGGMSYGFNSEVLAIWTGTGLFEYQCPDPIELYQVGVFVQWKAYNNSTWNTSFAILDTETEAHEYFDFPVWDAGEWMTDVYWLGITTLGTGDITVGIENPMDYETNRTFKVVVVKLS